MTGTKAIVLKLTVFLVLAAMLLVVLVNTMADDVGGQRRSYSATFEDVNGLKVGDDVKAAGVNVGEVTEVEVSDAGDAARIRFDLVDGQELHDNTRIVMRYHDLLGQRYLGLAQPEARGASLPAGSTIPLSRTDPGFDLTELLNGFRPLFDVLDPKDVNELAESTVRVLQGESGNVEQLLTQTASLTTFVANRDEVIGAVMTNLEPVLQNIAGQGTEIKSTVKELRRMMAVLAEDREQVGSAIDGIGELVGSTSDLMRDAKEPLTGTSRELRKVAGMLRDSQGDLETALPQFAEIFRALGASMSFENALNIHICSLTIRLAEQPVNLGNPSNRSEACR